MIGSEPACNVSGCKTVWLRTERWTRIVSYGPSMQADLMREYCVTSRIEASTTKQKAAPEAGDSAHPKIISLV